MEITLSLFAAMVSVLPLLISLTAYAKAADLERSRMAKPKPERDKHSPTMNHADRTRLAVRKREHSNFMNYDGRAQMPIDQDTILADSEE